MTPPYIDARGGHEGIFGYRPGYCTLAIALRTPGHRPTYPWPSYTNHDHRGVPRLERTGLGRLHCGLLVNMNSQRLFAMF